MCATLALLCLVALTACSNTTKPLQPIPAPVPPAVVKVPVLVRLDPSITTPCPMPPKRVVKTDVDLLEVADAFKVTARCNERKLHAVEEAQPLLP